MHNKIIVSAIAAMTENRVIGKNNQLPWHLPADLQHFKALTIGKMILMGRKTYESIGKALPNRSNLILTRNESYAAPNCHVVKNLHEAFAFVSAAKQTELFIIGGAQLYAALLPQIQRIYLTLIHENLSGDTFFPELDPNDWQTIAKTSYARDAQHIYAFDFLTLQRIR